MFELAMVNESSVFELLRFDCIFHLALLAVERMTLGKTLSKILEWQH